MNLARLAGHLAEIPGWGARAIELDELDIAPVGGPLYMPTTAESREHVVAVFDKNVQDTLDALAKVADDAVLMQPWKLLGGGRKLMEMPRVAVMRNFCLNHLIHHRGQFSLYLRLNNVSVPSIYGPSADEGRIG